MKQAHVPPGLEFESVWGCPYARGRTGIDHKGSFNNTQGKTGVGSALHRDTGWELSKMGLCPARRPANQALTGQFCITGRNSHDKDRKRER